MSSFKAPSETCMEPRPDLLVEEGLVIEVLEGQGFRVRLADGLEARVQLGGMLISEAPRIRNGDRVPVQITTSERDQGCIVFPDSALQESALQKSVSPKALPDEQDGD
ncbi:MAG: hypothetical protein ACYTG5_04235 [Planctomycetota bacterium]|jgi:translation initiation factor IF-1